MFSGILIEIVQDRLMVGNFVMHSLNLGMFLASPLLYKYLENFSRYLKDSISRLLSSIQYKENMVHLTPLYISYSFLFHLADYDPPLGQISKPPMQAAEAALHLVFRLTDLSAPVLSSNNLANRLEGWIPIVMDGSRSVMNSLCKLFSLFLEIINLFLLNNEAPPLFFFFFFVPAFFSL